MEPAQGDPVEDAPEPSGCDGKTLSKRQAKKLERMQRREEFSKKRRIEEREKRKLQQAAKKAKVQQLSASLPAEELEARRTAARERAIQRKEERAASLAKRQHALEHGMKVVIDLDYADLMSYQEQKSLVQQLSYCISANKNAEIPCSLHLASYSGVMKEALEKQFPQHTNWHMGLHGTPFHEVFKHDLSRVVYLTADSDNTLQDLQPDSIYIIGGIVDRNRHKGICLQRAQKHEVQAARLPIAEHLKLAGSKVLTVNHVVSLLLKFLETSDWKAACEHVIPIRKQAAEGDEDEPHCTTEGAAPCELHGNAPKDPITDVCQPSVGVDAHNAATW